MCATRARLLVALAACAALRVAAAQTPAPVNVTAGDVTATMSFQAADSNGTTAPPYVYAASTRIRELENASTTATTPVSGRPLPTTNPATAELADAVIDAIACPTLESSDTLTQSEMIRRMVADCRYDKLLRPGGSHRVLVHARTYIYFIQPAEAHDLQFKLHFLLQLRYTDERLVYRQYSPERRRIIGENQLKDLIWVPHIFLSNERDSSIMGTDAKDVLVSISPEGEVTFSRRIQAVLYCWLNLQKFPFDEQTCSMNFETWMYNISEMQLKWEKEYPVQLAPELHLTEYSLLSQWTNETFDSGESYDPRHGGFAGNYSTLQFSFRLAREMGYYLMDYFIPSIMIVSISWVSFWLQADQSAPRIMLGTSTMLSFITLASTQSKTLPKVSYIKASEIWFLGCTGFIFGSLVEFAFVNTIWRRKKTVALKNVNSKYILKNTLTPRLARKELQKEFIQGALHKSHSCSSLDEEPRKPANKQNTFNNYLTVHSFPSQLNLPTITTQSFDDLIPEPTSQSSTGAGATNSCNGTSAQCLGNSGDSAVPRGWTTMTPQEIAIWIDTRSRFLFPLAFLVFNVIYWTFVYCL